MPRTSSTVRPFHAARSAYGGEDTLIGYPPRSLHWVEWPRARVRGGPGKPLRG
ncbi:hypothetical protein FH063_000175 [Azospirillum argentinense]|uniref:Uncharacterized protein n=1 Tax=Azospirillum argentinense TaxID=2970906 RepID=A0A5B0L0X4_9PROT|nr:hypothetical protein FH063_000175 [Azospirillum argentinense]